MTFELVFLVCKVSCFLTQYSFGDKKEKEKMQKEPASWILDAEIITPKRYTAVLRRKWHYASPIKFFCGMASEETSFEFA